MKKILFAMSECRPFCASGGLSDVGGSLPQALSGAVDVGVVMPFYKCIRENYNPELVKCETVDLDWRHQQTKLYHLAVKKVDYFFVDCPRYFDRDSLYGYMDDPERFCFFDKAVVELLASDYDLIHCHDWQTAVIPSMLKAYGNYRPTVLTIHNIEYQGTFLREHLKDLTGLDSSYGPVFDWNWGSNMLKGGIVHCDRLTTVSPNYANEIKNPTFSSGLSGIIKANEYKLSGILNGIDCETYNALHDKAIAANFGIRRIEGKSACKAELQTIFGLPVSDAPLFAVVSRLVGHKGMDILCDALPSFLDTGAQFIVLGTGEQKYVDALGGLCYRQNFSARFGFDATLARKIYAGADFFVMPSKSEPCGLAQMIACRYATLPIVRRVGGLADSIGEDCGILFDGYDGYALRWALDKAWEIYNIKRSLGLMRYSALKRDFSWNASAKKYLALYRELIGE